MIGYQQTFKPSFAKARLAQSSLSAAPVPPPAPDPIFIGYTGVPGFFEVLGVLAVSGSAAWVGIRTGMSEKKNVYLKAAGWVGGVGSVLIGLLYLGAKSGLNQVVGIPGVRVTPI